MSIRKITRTSGEIKWEVRVHENGRGSKRIKRIFDKKIDAEKYLFEFKKEILTKIQSPFKDCSFEGRLFRDEAEFWLRDGEVRFSKSHFKRVQGILNEIFPKMGNLPIEKITSEFLSRYQQQEIHKGSANQTVNRKTEVMMAILNCSVRHRRIPFSPAAGFRKLKRSSKEMSFWNESEALSFLGFINEHYPRGSEKRWVYLVYLLALNTGLRAGEIWGMKPRDLSQGGRSIWIQRQFNRVTLDFSETKGKKSRHVPCPEDLHKELMWWVSKKSIRQDSTVFQNEVGKPVCHDHFADRQFKKDIEAWGGRRIRFHDLRHTAATLMIARGIDLKSVKEICGHADIKTTMNYVHMISGSVERVSDLFAISPTVGSLGITRLREAVSE